MEKIWDLLFVYRSASVDFSVIENLLDLLKTGEMMISTGGNFKVEIPNVSMTYIQVLKRKDYDTFEPYDRWKRKKCSNSR